MTLLFITICIGLFLCVLISVYQGYQSYLLSSIVSRLQHIENSMNLECVLSDKQAKEIDSMNLKTGGLLELRRYKKQLEEIEQDLGINDK